VKIGIELKENKMKKTLIALILLFGSANYCLASELYARVVQVEANYETVTEYTPVKICRDEEVPIYGNTGQSNDNAGNVLLGMILGGVSGKVITGEDGGAAVGAIAGGLIGANNNNNNNNQIIGYRTVQSCTMNNKEINTTKLKNYRITYDFHGALGTSYSYNSYLIGDNIPVRVNVVAK
jgi:uncharacterized protein YcfJ|tara:strand:+ start:119 stop:658 length:540 start_codon:yes stop_codon:yes gene_type:complete